jgi:ubiquinone/menaquinone biosynthesis C-methylase UbiE
LKHFIYTIKAKTNFLLKVTKDDYDFFIRVYLKNNVINSLKNPNEISTAYDIWSQNYETVENRTRDLAAFALREQGAKLRNKDVLEIGCGTGVNTRYLAENCRSVAAVDFSAGMVEKARVNVTAENVRFIEGDIQLGWQFADASFDFIVCTLVLEHIENLRHVFAEARRVLREGGEFWLYELHPFRQMQGGQAQFKSDNGTTTLITAYLHSVSEFVNTAIEAGFEIVRLDEWRDGDDAANNLSPRLLSLNVRVS